jgi:ribosomal protein L29
MKKTDKINLRQKSSNELLQLLSATQKELAELRIQLSKGVAKDTSAVAKLNYKIAYINTLLGETIN